MDKAQELFLNHLPALDPRTVKAKRYILATLVHGDNGEWYFDERLVDRSTVE